MTKPRFPMLLALLTALLLITAAACGGEDHAHGPDTHTHDGAETHAATPADTAGTYVDTTGAFFDADPDAHHDAGDADHEHGDGTHTHDEDGSDHE